MNSFRRGSETGFYDQKTIKQIQKSLADSHNLFYTSKSKKVFKEVLLKSIYLLVMLALIGGGFLVYLSKTYATGETWTQTTWSGGQTSNTALHPTNSTNWTEFSSATNINAGDSLTIGIGPVGTLSTDFTNESDYVLEDLSYSTSVTPSATIGTITLTLGSGNWNSNSRIHQGCRAIGNSGEALLIAEPAAQTTIIAQVLTNFSNTNSIANGDWKIHCGKIQSGKVRINNGVDDGSPQMVKDVNGGGSSYSSSPNSFVSIGNVSYFSATTSTYGAELWRTDGTSNGTYMVKDIYSGSNGSSPLYLTNFNGTLFFSASNGTNGTELWKSDGTSAGTSMVKDIYSGASNSGPLYLTVSNGILFFSAIDGINGTELWKSDGTSGGTSMVKNIYSGSSSSSPDSLTNVNGTLFFSATEATNGKELWKSDGTDSGTSLVKDIYTGATGSYPSNLISYNGILLFSASALSIGNELFRSDGTVNGTYNVKDIYGGGSGSSPSYLTYSNGSVYFAATTGANGTELWRTDGTFNATTMAMDINPGTSSSNPYYLADVNSTLYFQATTSTNGAELWRSDGLGTSIVKDIVSGSGGSNPFGFTNFNNTLFFSASDGTNGSELWKSDGTSGGTSMVKDIYSGSSSSVPNYIKVLNSIIIFQANDGVNGTELWKSDGTSGGTNLVKNVNTGAVSADPGTAGTIVNMNGTLYFSATDGVNGTELWKSDGTESGTSMVKDIYSGSSSSNPNWLTNMNGTLYFSANDGTNGVELWKSDGTSGGTSIVKNIYSGSSNSYPKWLTEINGTLYFSAADGSSSGEELWKSDGTSGGTVLVKDINSGASSSPQYLTNVNGTLYFAAIDATAGYELFKSDGTSGGTVLVKDIRPGSANGWPTHIVAVGDTVYFSADNGSNGREPWKSDGTEAGTVMIKDITSAAGGSSPMYFTNVNGTVFFGAYDSTHGTELWKTDGTSAGTSLIKDISPGANASFISYVEGRKFLININGTLYFTAQDGTNGQELWRSDGTSAGTVMVKDINSGSGASSPGQYTEMNGKLYFWANDGLYGSEIYKLNFLNYSGSYYVTTNNSSQIDVSSIGQIAGATITQYTPSNTEIKYLISFDGRSTWKYWDGSSWRISSLLNISTDGMSKSTVEGLSQSQWSSSGGFQTGSTSSINIAANLSTTDSTVTPELDKFQINYNTFLSSADLTSSIYNTQVAPAALEKIQWTENLLANTDVKFQIRTSPDGTNWTAWCGPDNGVAGTCNSSTFFTSPTGTETIDDIQRDKSNDQYFQYKAFLSTSDSNYTPTISDLTLNFTTISAPTVTTDNASSITVSQATLSGNVTDNGSENPSDRFINFGITASYGSSCSAGSGGTGSFSCDAGTLSAGTLYHYQSCATNSGGTSCGSDKTFYTLPSTPTGVSASDGSYTDKVRIAWNSVTGATGYDVWDGSSWIDVGNATVYDHENAPAPTINQNATTASDGVYTSKVALETNADVAPGSNVTYKVRAKNSSGNSAESSNDDGNRGAGTLTYQWQRSVNDSDSNYSNLNSATSRTFDDTTAPVNGNGRYYRVILNANGSSQVTSSADRGYRDVGGVTIVDPNSTKMQNDINDGYLTPTGSPTNTSEATFELNHDFLSGNGRVSIAASTQMTEINNSSFNLLNFITTDKTSNYQVEISPSVLGGISFGVSGERVNFSQPVTVIIGISSGYNGKTFNVYSKLNGENVWNLHSTCTISNDQCVFTTDHATDYMFGTETVYDIILPVQLDINSTISIDCTDSVTMHAITGTGKSQWTGSENDAYCNVKTNNSDGYKLQWQASQADMENANHDTISAYTPTGLNPETWQVNNNSSEWGAKLMSTSTDYLLNDDDVQWGPDDTYTNGYWFNVDHTAPFQITATSKESAELGDEKYIRFGAEIGSDKFQPTGTYQVDVTMTATTL
jgi:ELWxxDGT repeat protein